ncbi:MAG: phosphodiester glycosidase family protein [Clostridia bacterium]|nr:phosphodiester glycosidase family protein [Clostridia bacterium]
MKKTPYILLLAVMLLAVLLLVPSPALMEEWTPDLSKLTKIPLDAPAGYPPDPDGYLSEYAYEDPTISIRIESTRYCETTVYVARVKIADASQLRTALAGPYGAQRTAIASKLAKRVNSVLAINGDYYSFFDSGLITRQGVTYRKRSNVDLDVLIIDKNGDFHVVKELDRDTLIAADEAMGGSVEKGGNIVQAFSFGPALVENGERAHDVFRRADGGATINAQRMAIAQDGPLSYVLVCCEGEDSGESKGLTLEEFGQFVISLDVETAYNMDGGGSTHMIFQGEKVNNLTTQKSRGVADIIYFTSGVAK